MSRMIVAPPARAGARGASRRATNARVAWEPRGVRSPAGNSISEQLPTRNSIQGWPYSPAGNGSSPSGSGSGEDSPNTDSSQRGGAAGWARPNPRSAPAGGRRGLGVVQPDGQPREFRLRAGDRFAASAPRPEP